MKASFKTLLQQGTEDLEEENRNLWEKLKEVQESTLGHTFTRSVTLPVIKWSIECLDYFSTENIRFATQRHT